MIDGNEAATRSPVLADLVGDTSTFLSEHWNRRPYIHRAARLDVFADLFSLEEFDAILADRNLREPYLRITRNGAALREERFMVPLRVQKMPVRGVVDTARAAHEFSAGATLLLDSIDHYHARIRKLCNELQAELKAPAEAVAFVTPKGVQGLSVHHDNTEVLVLQIQGTKQWTVYEQMRPLPKHGGALRPEEVGEPVLEAELRPGDTLYIPWGSPHFAVSGDDLSCHLSVMLRPPTWGSVLRDVVIKAFPPAYDPVPLLDADTSGLTKHARERLREAADRLRAFDLSAYMTETARTLAPHGPARAGFLRQAALRRDLGLSTRVCRNEWTPFQTKVIADGRIELRVETRTFRLPADSGPVLEAIGSMTHELTVAELCDPLPEEAATKLVDHLIGNGILRIAE